MILWLDDGGVSPDGCRRVSVVMNRGITPKLVCIFREKTETGYVVRLWNRVMFF